jgi:hypothetical protein
MDSPTYLEGAPFDAMLVWRAPQLGPLARRPMWDSDQYTDLWWQDNTFATAATVETNGQLPVGGTHTYSRWTRKAEAPEPGTLPASLVRSARSARGGTLYWTYEASEPGPCEDRGRTAQIAFRSRYLTRGPTVEGLTRSDGTRVYPFARWSVGLDGTLEAHHRLEQTTVAVACGATPELTTESRSTYTTVSGPEVPDALPETVWEARDGDDVLRLVRLDDALPGTPTVSWGWCDRRPVGRAVGLDPDKRLLDMRTPDLSGGGLYLQRYPCASEAAGLQPAADAGELMKPLDVALPDTLSPVEDGPAPRRWQDFSDNVPPIPTPPNADGRTLLCQPEGWAESDGDGDETRRFPVTANLNQRRQGMRVCAHTAGGGVVAAIGSGFVSYAPPDGPVTVHRLGDEAPYRATPLGDAMVVQGREGVWVVGPRGAQAVWQGRVQDAFVVGDHVVVHVDAGLLVFDADGALRDELRLLRRRGIGVDADAVYVHTADGIWRWPSSAWR